MEENKQHAQLPTDKQSDEVTPKDQVIYLAIKRHQSEETGEAFPSLQKIADESGASIPTVRNSIKVLENNGYLETYKKGRQIHYKFNPYKKFEVFSYDFLDKPKSELSFTEKSYIVSSQQYMFKDEESKLGKISYNSRELSEKIHMPESTIRTCNAKLKSKGILVPLKNRNLDVDNNATFTYAFDLEKLGQTIVFTLQNHEDRITNNEQQIQELVKKNEENQKLIRKLMDIVEDKNHKEKQEIIID